MQHLLFIITILALVFTLPPVVVGIFSLWYVLYAYVSPLWLIPIAFVLDVVTVSQGSLFGFEFPLFSGVACIINLLFPLLKQYMMIKD